MASYTDPPEEGRGRRDLPVVVGLILLSIVVLYLPPGTQARVAEGLQGTVLRGFDHPDNLKEPAPENILAIGTYLSGIAIVPGSDGDLLDLTGGELFDFDTERILRVGADTGEVIPGMVVPLDGVDVVCPSESSCIAHPRDGRPILYATTISFINPCLVEIEY